jgi:hypothetical protein
MFNNEALLFQTAVDTEPGIYTVVAKFTPKDDPSKPVYKITFNYEVLVLDSDGDGDPDSTDPEPNNSEVYEKCLAAPVDQNTGNLDTTVGDIEPSVFIIDGSNIGLDPSAIKEVTFSSTPNVIVQSSPTITAMGNIIRIVATIETPPGATVGDTYTIYLNSIKHTNGSVELRGGNDDNWSSRGEYI